MQAQTTGKAQILARIGFHFVNGGGFSALWYPTQNWITGWQNFSVIIELALIALVVLGSIMLMKNQVVQVKSSKVSVAAIGALFNIGLALLVTLAAWWGRVPGDGESIMLASGLLLILASVVLFTVSMPRRQSVTEPPNS